MPTDRSPVAADTRPLAPGAHRLQLLRDGAPLSWRAVAAQLQQDPAALSDAIAATGHPGLFWECVPVARDTADQPFSCVVLDSPAVARLRTDPRPFAGPLGGCTAPAVRTFDNLGGDAVLVAPCATGAPASHAQLAAFLAGAPAAQVQALWQAVGRAVQAWWAARPDPVWVSTSGLGVSWLHVRLDRRPKYYQWRPYRAWPAADDDD